jgi:hypothetical protein
MAVFSLRLPGNAALLPYENINDVDGSVHFERTRTYANLYGGPLDTAPSISPEVYFSFTIPVFFGVGAPPGQRMRLQHVFVTFVVERTLPTGVQVRRIRVKDKYSTIFNSGGGLGLPEYDGDASFTRYDDKVPGKNSFELNPAPLIQDSITIAIGVNFNEGGSILFTGAGIRLVIL